MNSKISKIGLESMASAGLSLVLLVAALTATISLLAPSANASSLGPSNAQRRALALDEAHHLLSLATLPAGSSKLAKWPAADGKALLSISPISGDPDETDLTNYFLAPKGPSARQWLYAHPPAGGSADGSGSGSGPGIGAVTYRTFSFRSSESFLSSVLQYATVITPSGQLGLRVDADVTWTPRKSQFSIVAPGATKVVVIAKRGLDTVRNARTSTTTTNASIIRDLIAHVNQLPAATPGVEMCPMDNDSTMTLQFFNAGASLPYSVVSAEPTGCGVVKILQYGANATLLGTTNISGGSTIAAYAAHLLGIKNWTGQATS